MNEWLSAFTLPRDGTVIVVLHLRPGEPTLPQSGSPYPAIPKDGQG